MTAPTNTYTITIADAHSHSWQVAGTPGNGGNTVAGKLDALRGLLNGQADRTADFAAFTDTDTITITVTQP